MIENKFTKRLVFVLVALMFVVASLFMFFSGFNVEAEDISVVNFNQYVKITGSYGSSLSYSGDCLFKVTSTLSSDQYFSLQSFSLVSGHQYYLKLSTTFDTWNALASGGSAIKYFKSSQIFTVSSDYSINRFYIYSGETSKNFYFNIIDLTQCFGVGFEPSTIEDVDTLFPSSYYNYTVGTPVNVGYENGYNQGLDVSFNSWSYTPSVNDWQMDIWYTTGNQLTIDSDGYTKLVVPSTSYPDAGTALYFNTGINIPKDSLVTFSFTDFRCDSGSVTVCYIADTSYGTYYDDFYSLSSGQYDLNYSNQFRVVFSPLVGFWIECTEGTTIRFKGIKFTILTYSDVLQDSYDTGYSEGFKNGQTFADNVSYNRGYADGLSMAEDSSFPVLMSSVVEAPLNAVLDIFNFEFMGYNLKNFITLVLTVCIIVAVIRLFLGGK